MLNHLSYFMKLGQSALITFHYRLHLKNSIVYFPREITLLMPMYQTLTTLCVSNCQYEKQCVLLQSHMLYTYCSQLKSVSVYSSIKWVILNSIGTCEWEIY